MLERLGKINGLIENKANFEVFGIRADTTEAEFDARWVELKESGVDFIDTLFSAYRDVHYLFEGPAFTADSQEWELASVEACIKEHFPDIWLGL